MKQATMDMKQTFINRGYLKIIQEILTICHRPAKKTHILYGCNLSFNQTQKYLEYLISCNLLNSTKNNEKRVYVTTDKGKEFLKKYEHLNRLMEMGVPRDFDGSA